MNKKAMFSQPMNGLSDEEIIKTREKAMAFLESKGYEVVNTFFTDEWYSKEKNGRTWSCEYSYVFHS